MNIVYIIEDYSENGGVEKIVSMKANTFYQEYHHQVTVISVYEDKRKQQYILDEGIRLIHLHVPFAKKTRNKVYKLLSRIITLLLAAYRLNKTIKQINPDVVFFTTTLGALLLPLCHTKARRIYESHLARSFNPFHSLFGLMERKADAVVCLTHDDAKEFQSAKNVYVIPNFINIPHQKVKDYSCKKAIAVGRLEQQKGFDRLITHLIKSVPLLLLFHQNSGFHQNLLLLLYSRMVLHLKHSRNSLRFQIMHPFQYRLLSLRLLLTV